MSTTTDPVMIACKDASILNRALEALAAAGIVAEALTENGHVPSCAFADPETLANIAYAPAFSCTCPTSISREHARLLERTLEGLDGLTERVGSAFVNRRRRELEIELAAIRNRYREVEP